MTATQRAAASMSSRAPAHQVSSRLFATRTRRRALPGPRPSLVPRASSASTNDSSSSVSVTTFNVLAPCYKRVTNPEDGSIAMEATFSELALERQARIVDMLCSDVRSSILCLQEFWHASEEVRGLYERGLRDAGYVTHSTPRTGGRPDGLLTAVRASEFDVLDRRDILFNDCGDRVAALLHLRHAASGSSETAPAESASSVGDVLLVNTHLLFPHNSNSTLIRLRESFKILEYLHEYQEKMMSEVTENGGVARRLPVVMCGDFNGSVRGAVARFLQSQGFISAFEECRRCLSDENQTDDGACWISHLNHHGECVGVDHIWVLNPSKQRAQAGSGAPPPSWKTAIYAMIQAKMLEKGLVSNDDAFSFFDVDDDMGITRDEFDMAVRMLDLTGESTPGLIESEISTLYDDCDKDGNGLVDFGEFIRKLDVESMDRAYRAIRTSQDIEEGPWDVVGDLMTAAASPTVLAGFTVDESESFDDAESFDAPLESEDFGGGAGKLLSAATLVARSAAPTAGDLAVKSARLPAAMEEGRWPEEKEFDLSNHGPLTAVLTPKSGKKRGR